MESREKQQQQTDQQQIQLNKHLTTFWIETNWESNLIKNKKKIKLKLINVIGTTNLITFSVVFVVYISIFQ